jgi:hypothetical protein
MHQRRKIQKLKKEESNTKMHTITIASPKTPVFEAVKAPIQKNTPVRIHQAP